MRKCEGVEAHVCGSRGWDLPRALALPKSMNVPARSATIMKMSTPGLQDHLCRFNMKLFCQDIAASKNEPGIALLIGASVVIDDP